MRGCRGWRCRARCPPGPAACPRPPPAVGVFGSLTEVGLCGGGGSRLVFTARLNLCSRTDESGKRLASFRAGSTWRGPRWWFGRACAAACLQSPVVVCHSELRLGTWAGLTKGTKSCFPPPQNSTQTPAAVVFPPRLLMATKNKTATAFKVFEVQNCSE